jgi:hypothetical protein
VAATQRRGGRGAVRSGATHVPSGVPAHVTLGTITGECGRRPAKQAVSMGQRASVAAAGDLKTSASTSSLQDAKHHRARGRGAASSSASASDSCDSGSSSVS